MFASRIAAIGVAIAALAGCNPPHQPGTVGVAHTDTAPTDTGRERLSPTLPQANNRVTAAIDTPPPSQTRPAAPKQDAATPPQPGGDAVPARITRRFPEAVAFEARTEPFAHGVVIGSEGIIGYEVDSDEAGTTQDGYGGPVPLLVWFDGRGRVTEVKVLGNDETPGYLDIVLKSGLLDSLKGLSAPEPREVDAVAMATASSRAIIDGTRLTAERVCRELLRR